MAGLTKQALIDRAEEKLADAKVLLGAGRFGNAYYLAGYAAEILLKAIIVRRFRAETLPNRKLVNDIHTHELEKLKNLAGLGDALTAMQTVDATFYGLWQVVAAWTEEARYLEWTEAQARQLVQALDDPRHGVMQWLRQHL